MRQHSKGGPSAAPHGESTVQARVTNRAYVVIGTLMAVIALGAYGSMRALRVADPDREFQEAWQAMEVSEGLIRALTPELGRLSTSIMNLELPDHRTREIFATQIDVVDLADAPPMNRPGTRQIASVAFAEWSLARAQAQVSRGDIDLWRPLLSRAEYFDHAKLSIVRGRLLDGRDDVYQIDVAFEALVRLESGETRWVEGDVEIEWSRAGRPGARVTDQTGSVPRAQIAVAIEEEAANWVITRFETLGLRVTESPRPLFADVLDAALDEADAISARRSIHEELVLDLLLDPEGVDQPPFFTLPASDRHPGVAVVDLDRDGWDDIYVMARWGRNQFFRNRGDGTFEEIAAELGLDFEDHTSSAIFADFDNDGDHDVFLGRTLERSIYLENTGGRFTDRSTSLPADALPYLVSSVSAVDYDGDGLLDLYLSRYAAEMLQRVGSDGSLSEYLSEADAAELDRRRSLPEAHRHLNWPGPPNVLLRNEGGGRFSVVEDAPALRIFSNTYQTTWADFDGDGDQDAYIANDFAPNHFVRNDGEGTFVDITDDTGTADLGFGMGASWGDYDGDGRQDLYVSNMFSKAGIRITDQLGALEPRFSDMARGNSLFRNGSDGFEKVSGVDGSALPVERAGWGWGSQFVDLNNDGHLDLYALSGYYTAPSEVELPFDI